MKRLAIIRHAKTEQQGYDRDYNRELLPRGIRDAENIASELKKNSVIPHKIISSPASRAIATAKIMAEVLGFPAIKIEEMKDLYFDSSTQDFVDLLQKTNDSVETLFIVGHNPFMHYVAQNMSKNYDGHMPTCSTVVLDFDVEHWKHVEPRKGLLFLHLYPKNLK
ncbi:MAG: histidine phosphatase family protein [Prolixibacteraceae bacterium]